MAHVQWCVGNTTLREAARLKDALRVLKENFDGQAWSYENQQRFLELLSTAKASDSEESIYDIGEDKSDKQIEQHGRIWAAAFNELGFATCYKKGNKYVSSGVHVTAAGDALLSDDFIDQDIWLRQLLKVQFPNPLPQKTKSHYPDFALIPFVAVLVLIRECDGVSKGEGFIINTIQTLRDIAIAKAAIMSHRARLEVVRKKGLNAVKKQIAIDKLDWAKRLYRREIQDRMRLIDQFAKEEKAKEDVLLKEIVRGGKGSKTPKALLLSSRLKHLKIRKAPANALQDAFLDYFLKLKSGAWGDYIDATARYFRMSGVLTIRRNRIQISEVYQEVVDKIITQEWRLASDGQYLSHLHNPHLPILPQDDEKFTKKSVDATFKRVKSRMPDEIAGTFTESIQRADNQLKKRKVLVDLLEQEKQIKENDYMIKLHNNADSPMEINQYFDEIMHGEILGDRPTHFEWNTWRGFLAIDKLSKAPYECRNFKIDDDLQPVRHAPGNRADMVFTYKDFVLVVEVTLQTGETQYSSEGEPVPRHVVKLTSKKDSDRIYGLFIAPSIHVNTARQFYGNMTSIALENPQGEAINPRIIPITLDEYKSILSIFQSKRFTPNDLRSLLDDIIGLQNDPNIHDGSHWINEIDKVIQGWAEKL